MAKNKTTAEEYKEIFCKLHKYQVHGADNLITLLIRYVRGEAEYKAKYIDLVSERSGVPQTSHITTTNADIMKHVVSAMVEIDKGIAPLSKDIDAAWSSFIEDYRNNRIKL